MEASVRFNDLRGTSSADVETVYGLDKWAEYWGVDIEKFTPIGLEFSTASDSDRIVVKFICTVKETESAEFVHFVTYEMTHADILSFLKRFSVVLFDRNVENTDITIIRTIELPKQD